MDYERHRQEKQGIQYSSWTFHVQTFIFGKIPARDQTEWIDKQHPVFMATPEKALCDYVTLNEIPFITNAKAAKEFLAHDLRIDSENWHRLDIRRLLRLNRVYKNATIASVLEVL